MIIFTIPTTVLKKTPTTLLTTKKPSTDQMQTYHEELCRRYFQLSTLLEVEVAVVSQQLRENNSKMTRGIHDDKAVGKQKKMEEKAGQSGLKEHAAWLHQQQEHLDEAWKSMRWVAEVISNARDSRLDCTVQLISLL